MSASTTPPSAGCLLCLVQASDSMRPKIYAGPVATKIAAALRMVNALLDELAAFSAGEGAGLAPIEVGVLAYDTSRDGKPRLRSLLSGTSAVQPLMPVAALDPSATETGPDGARVWVQTATSGAAPGRKAVAHARVLLERWALENPGAPPPLLVHCTDGESSDGALAPNPRAPTAAVPATLLIHCLFRQGLPPSEFIPIPQTPSGDLWAMSSLMPSEDTSDPDSRPRRALFVNKRSASSTIGRLVRWLWSQPVQPEPMLSAATAPEATDAPPATAPAAIAPVAPAEPAAEPEPESEPESAPAAPAEPARFEVRALWTPKRGNAEKEWEDGYAFNPAAGVLAMADGASDGVFTKLWATQLLDSYLADPIPLDDLAVVEPWILERRRAWFTAINYPEQRWSIQRKVDQSCGAATFLGFRLDPPPAGAEGSDPSCATGWTAWAVGDVCLFHIRDGRLLAWFPVGSSSDFGCAPQLYQSKAMRPTPPGVVTRGELVPGDLVVFATDALAQRLLGDVEAGEPPVWGRFWDIDQAVWRQEIEALRDRGTIVNDDCTLVVLRLPAAAAPTLPVGLDVAAAVAAAPPEEVAAEADVVEPATILEPEPDPPPDVTAEAVAAAATEPSESPPGDEVPEPVPTDESLREPQTDRSEENLPSDSSLFPEDHRD